MSHEPPSNGLSGQRDRTDASHRSEDRQDPYERWRQPQGKADGYRAPDLHDRESQHAQRRRWRCSSWPIVSAIGVIRRVQAAQPTTNWAASCAP